MSKILEVNRIKYSEKDSISKIPALTGIRGIAAIWVVLFHLSAVAAASNIHYFENIPILRSGYLAVDMFFILSGFVLALTYSYSLAKPTKIAIRDFWIGRMFRILPLHWLALTLLLIIYVCFDENLVMTQRHDTESFIASAFLVQNWLLMPKSWNLPAWSLSAEWLAYVVLPIIIMASTIITSPIVAIISAATLWLVLFAACLLGSDISLDHIRGLGLIRCLIEFPIGVVIYRLSIIKPLTIKHYNIIFSIGLIILSVAMISSSLDILAVPSFSMIVLAAGGRSTFAKKLIGNRFAIIFGNISFSAYILHWLMIEMAAYYIVNQNMNDDINLYILMSCFISIWPLAWLSWKCIELPFQKLGKSALIYIRTNTGICTDNSMPSIQ